MTIRRRFRRATRWLHPWRPRRRKKFEGGLMARLEPIDRLKSVKDVGKRLLGFGEEV